MYEPPKTLSWDRLRAHKFPASVWRSFRQMHGGNEIPISTLLIHDLLGKPTVTTDALARLLFTAEQYSEFKEKCSGLTEVYAKYIQKPEQVARRVLDRGEALDRSLLIHMFQALLLTMWQERYGIVSQLHN